MLMVSSYKCKHYLSTFYNAKLGLKVALTSFFDLWGPRGVWFRFRAGSQPAYNSLTGGRTDCLSNTLDTVTTAAKAFVGANLLYIRNVALVSGVCDVCRVTEKNHHQLGICLLCWHQACRDIGTTMRLRNTLLVDQLCVKGFPWVRMRFAFLTLELLVCVWM